MLTWLRAIIATGNIASLIKSLMIPFAYLYGRWSAFREQWKINEQLQEKYNEIEAKPLTDEDVDNRLDAGTL